MYQWTGQTLDYRKFRLFFLNPFWRHRFLPITVLYDLFEHLFPIGRIVHGSP